MTDAIEAGARAMERYDMRDYEWTDEQFNTWWTKDSRSKPERDKQRARAKACIEAAIASGALVPASAVAEMRERCAAKCDALGDEIMARAEAAHEDEEYDEYESLECAASEYSRAASEIRQLGIAPASGDYVVVPRGALTILMDKTEDFDDEGPCGEGWLSDELEQARKDIEASLHAASSNGGEK